MFQKKKEKKKIEPVIGFIDHEPVNWIVPCKRMDLYIQIKKKK